MADVLLLHHARGRTPGMRSLADRLGAAGHTVHLPDLYEGRVFDDLDAGVAHARSVGFDVLLERGRAAAEGLPDDLVVAGVSLGVMPAQALAQSRPGVRGALLLEAFLPTEEFGAWPRGVPVQVHGMADDPFFAGDGDLAAARDLLAAEPGLAEVFVYPGEEHLFTDPSLASHDEAASALLLERVLAFLERVDEEPARS
ncbi:dienelactone hydrolase family protein [Nocardioides sp. zg-DK7169]|uniref:dienelactone hydrolase family protein n=1 Tax=Nocardioides sp. zg-DK7169 TaxID=2736600 RepID=UPI0015524A55|nr:dienelactone hydrolase family protein [Nocardioides sp. zg-DK7169]NPC97186.1 dienelactone hydrolase [Nocardioides sp. zg-DK7169]